MSILQKILETKHQEITQNKAARSIEALKKETAFLPRGFVTRLRSAQAPAVIAEIKRASPSKGPIRPDLDPVTTAERYEAGGAACLSVLTDRTYFGGAPEYVTQIRATQDLSLPLLRKEFIIDPYQVWESRAIGADALLLIAAALSEDELATLLEETRRAGLDVLLEVHTEEEIVSVARVLGGVSAEARSPRHLLLGINNRDLKTFITSLEVTQKLVPIIRERLPDGDKFSIVAESGIMRGSDALTLSSYGADAYLIGESLVAEGDPGDNVARLLKEFRKGETL